ncbi:MAG: thermonuclease family protein [Nitrospiraceae bacterium]
MDRSRALEMAGLMALALGALLSGAPDAAADSITFKAMVADTEDGDTLIVIRNHARIRLEIPEIDAPELDQPYGKDAKKKAAALTKNKVVTIRAYGNLGQNYLLGEVWLPNKKHFAMEMVRAGLAWVKEGRSVLLDLEQLQSEAKTAQQGLWADEEPIPPWEWRSGRRK